MSAHPCVTNVFDQPLYWENNNFYPQKFECHQKMKPHLNFDIGETGTPASIFWKEFFTDELLDFIVVETNRYQNQKPLRAESLSKQKPWKDIHREELRAYFTITMLMGYRILPEAKDHWSKNPGLENLLIKSTMSRDRYFDISAKLHFCNNEEHDNDNKRLWKIQGVIDRLSSTFESKMTNGTHVVVDETPLKYSGRLGFKDYICNKESKSEFRVYRLCSSDDDGKGYTLKLKVCRGNDAHPTHQEVVMDFVRPLNGQGCTIALDQRFTCPELVKQLYDQHFNVIGTVQGTREYLPQNMMNLNLAKGQILSANYGPMNYIVWKNVRTVRILSTMHKANLETSSKNKTRPRAMIDYNKCRIGINISDQLSTSHQAAKRTIKWYKKMFFYFFDIALMNAFICYKTVVPVTGRQKFFITFCMNVVNETLNFYNREKEIPRVMQAVPSSVVGVDRFATGGHFLSNHARRNCHVCWRRGCRQTTKFRCKICDVSLCVDPCCKIYHTENKF